MYYCYIYLQPTNQSLSIVLICCLTVTMRAGGAAERSDDSHTMSVILIAPGHADL